MIVDKGNRSTKGVDVLIAVEDPGAANFILDLPDALAAEGFFSHLLAYGHAREFLRGRGMTFHETQGADEGATLDAFAPRLLLAGTSQSPDSSVLAMIVEARQRAITTVSFVDMAVDAALRFCGRTDNALEYAPDYLIVPDLIAKAAFEQLSFPAENIILCEHPALKRVRGRRAQLQGRDLFRIRTEILGADPAPRKVWLFVAEHVDGCEYARMHRGADYTLHGRGGSDRRTDIVLEEVLDAAREMAPRPFIILRLHPKNSREEFTAYLSEVDMVSGGGDPLDLVWASDLVIGLSSVLLLEAAHMGRPTLSVVPRAEECAWAPSVALGLTLCVSDREGVRNMLADVTLKGRSSLMLKQDILKTFSDAVTALLHN